MNNPYLFITPILMAAQGAETEAAPDWVHLLPTAAGAIQTVDQRGPYHLADATALIAASFEGTDRLIIDECHATDIAAVQGLPAPARGWIVEMQAREDGVWGRVEWNKAGRALLADRAYRGISPVVTLQSGGKTLHRILRASLVNRPNFRGLATLNQETTMSLTERLAALLGLEGTATEEQLLNAVQDHVNKPEAAALQSALPDEIVALQSEISTLATDLKTERDGRAREKAQAFVDGEIKKGRTGVKPSRERFISMHMADPAGTEEIVNGLLVVDATRTRTDPPPAKEGEISLNAAQAEAARHLGIDPKAYAATLKAETEEAAQ